MELEGLVLDLQTMPSTMNKKRKKGKIAGEGIFWRPNSIIVKENKAISDVRLRLLRSYVLPQINIRRGQAFYRVGLSCTLIKMTK